ncbi:PLP-dependent aminotransferase family protein [Rhodoferax lacus]|uniref:PLP-dependent aminotransferase family protein n=1 Tax=Rhodoferax lacus TaxID=2184758 RepID=A0A3E1RG95_9BURK|nr:PLP-dependent aminotransferase family protein [Rhodoferax lacus]RFO98374.1 PLP-dependent aminotransferase family protein [Rhodoferax lacus]
MPADNLITTACFQDTRKPRYLAIADELAQAILNGQLPTGERLPPQRKLAQRLSVTAGTVSHAYALLEQRGLATARVGDGTYVHAPSQTPKVADSATPVDLAHNVAIPTQDGAALASYLQRLALDERALGEVLSYQPELGHMRHRQAGAQWLRRFGTTGDANRVMVTHGAQHGLSCVLRTLARPGDAVLTESLSYAGLQAQARLMRLQLVGIEMDAEGMLPDALDHAARHIDAKLLYCSPSLHNPSNASMSMRRRELIAQVARRHNLLLVEDAVHAAAQAQPLPALSTLLPEQSFLLSSFSKVAGPGLRVGYVEAAPQWLSKLAASMRADCWMVAPLMPDIVSDWIESGVAEQLIAAQRAAIAQRLALALPLLQSLDYCSDPESPLIWLPLPEPWRAGPFSAALRQAGVLVRTADHFAVGRAPAPHAVRISLNAAKSGAEVETGLRTLVGVLRGLPTAQP